ncbi:MAG TPA: GH32 C-terminal domain-containing protein [Candidatus Paceibacterota bacterium]|nr:GH32 C-terminal domain-containing protein [Candidatus Paceibacterota bacterium]
MTPSPCAPRSARSRLLSRQVVLAALLAASVWGASAAEPSARPDILIADFERADYGDWTATGQAFGPGPARGTLSNQMAVEGYLGERLVNSFFNGDGTTGTLTSPLFRIERRYLQFLIGGGMHPGQACMNLLLDGQVVRTATGPNDRPGGSERLDWQQWDVGEFGGRQAALQIVDSATGGWGHINVDHIRLSDRALPGLLTNVVREFAVERRYLNLPVKQRAPKRRVRLEVGSRVVREFEIELADAAPDFWVFLDLTPFAGRRAALGVDRLPEDSKALDLVDQTDAFRGADGLYREPLRPQFHFSSRRGWNNDPNGLVYYRGEYHLFYQHNPYGWDWGNMHWGHAVSTDLVHWCELPIALYPVAHGDWVFSGSAVVDARNTGGFKTGSEEVLVAAYTSTGRGECIVYSNDRGRSWTEYAGNPVVKHEGRDPRLFWHAPTGRWCMAVYDEFEGGRWIAFYSSPDLKAWTFHSRIEGFFECPDIFELPVDAQPGEGTDGGGAASKWVLTAANSAYQLGRFDGRVFTAETPMLPGHRGESFYAAQTYSDMPDGRRVQIGWGQMATPGMPFNQMMTFPCELSLRTTGDGVRLCWQPVRELDRLRARKHTFDPQALEPGVNPLANLSVDLHETRIDVNPGSASALRLSVGGVDVIYAAAARELICKKHRAPLRPRDGRVSLRVLVDRTSIEIFGNEGEVYMPVYRPPELSGTRSVGLLAEGGAARVRSLEVNELESIWFQAQEGTAGSAAAASGPTIR